MTRKTTHEAGPGPQARHVRARRKSASTTKAAGGGATGGAPQRIAKVMARAGLCSRREAEAWIAAGRVAVNGKVITSAALNVGAADRIVVDGQPLPARERTRLFLYHKRRGLLTTRTDPEGRPTVFDALPKELPRLVAVGRLDLNTEGLLLLTNEGGLARILELPSTGWLRRYRVRAHGRITQAELDALKDGVTVDGVRYGPIEATLDREQGSNVWLTFAIREGKNREVRNVLGALGLEVNRLIRTSFGPFQLGDIPEGGIEEVRLRTLRDQLGTRIAAAAGVDFDAPVIPRPAEPEPADKRMPSGHRTRAPRFRPPMPEVEEGARSQPPKGRRSGPRAPAKRSESRQRDARRNGRHSRPRRRR